MQESVASPKPARRRRTLAFAAALAATAVIGVGLAGAGASPPPPTASVVVPVTPFRVLDTRQGIGTGGTVARIGADSTVTLAIAGVGTVPADATGVVLNLTASNATAAGWVAAYPTGASRPDTSVLNITPGQDLPNMITAALGDGGGLDLYNAFGDVDLIADVAAYLVPAGSAGAGPQGPQGLRGPAAWDVIPSGTTVVGTFIHDDTAAGVLTTDNVAINLPGVAPQPIDGLHANFAAHQKATDADASCTGTAQAPTAPPGKVCLYLNSISPNVTGVSGFATLLPTRSFGIEFTSNSNAAGQDITAWVSWAYTAP